ncbi:unnamed protein product [Echinostoma caproni]|uniref:EGF-like domain-containing protein n=1 Tax=Echinostoma caproni TaxID=27848 RepID=A0A183AF87_9TREM|nr:unnamed protein product [Echinostoma caproni]
MTATETIQLHVITYLTNGSVHFTAENYAQHGLPSLENGGLQRRHIDCLSDYGTCVDAQWHQLRQAVVKNSLVISLDNQPPITYIVPYTTSRLSIQAVHLGFRPTTPDMKLFGSSLIVPRQRFKGCMRRLFYKTRDQKLPLLSVEKQNIVEVHLSRCEVKEECGVELLNPPVQRIPYTWSHRSGTEYVSFRRPGGYIRVPGWHVVLTGEVSFRFRTKELNGLLIYSSSVNQYELTDYAEWTTLTEPIPGGGKAGFDIFALELRDGHLFCVINTGSGSLQLGQTSVNKKMKSVTFLADGKEHRVKIQFHEGSLAVEVDDRNYMAYTADEKMYKYLNLNGVFYIGGVPEPIRRVSSFISPEVWSTRLRWDYIGCLGELRVDGRLWDVDLERRACWAREHVEAHCETRSITQGQCSRDSCANGGRCINGWDRFVCDCFDTHFIGQTCSEEPIVAEFNGHQWISVSFSPFPVQSTVEDLVIRFQTKQKSALLLTTRSPSLAASDCLELRINAGYVQLMYDFGEESKSRDKQMSFLICINLPDIPKDGRFLSHKQIILGRSSKIAEPNSVDAFPDRPVVLPPAQIKLTMFIGNIMAFWFNGLDFLQVAKHLLTRTAFGVWRDRLEVTASERLLTPGQMLLEFPLSLETHDSYVQMELSGEYDQFVLEFWLKADKVSL